jgi:GT2 family glycosyltransferase
MTPRTSGVDRHVTDDTATAGTAAARTVDVVVNFYCASPSDDATRELLAASTEVSLRLLQRNPAVRSVLVVDGSAAPGSEIQAVSARLGVRYLHGGRELNFVEAYNLGWRSLDGEYVALMANDILPLPLDSMRILLDWVSKPDVGCAVPYMISNRAAWDETQRPSFVHRGRLSCEPASMTVNLNLFKRSVLEQIGGLDPNYHTGFESPILLIKIRRLGYRVVMVGDTRIMHIDSLTKVLGASAISKGLYERDRARFLQEYPRLASASGIANLDFSRWPFATTFASRCVWWAVYHLPRRLRRPASEIVMWLEPWLCRYPARWGRADRPEGRAS